MHTIQQFRILAFVALISCCQILPVAHAEELSWRYDLRPGDHLVYRYTFERHVLGGETESQTKASYTTHVLVLGGKNGHLSVGFQRNREAAELMGYREKGKDKLAQQKPDFDQRMAKREARFHEANEFDFQGHNLDYWQAARESPSKILLGIHEIAELPEHRLASGDKWHGHDLLGFDNRFAGMEAVSGKSCARIDGKNGIGRVSYWWCLESGVLGKVEFDGEYILFGNARAHEKLTLELVEKRRGESSAEWLKSADTQRGVLDALLLSTWVALPREFAELPLESQEPQVQALILSLIYQRRVHPLKTERLEKLAHAENVEVARIAGRLLDASPAPGKASPPERLRHLVPAQPA